MFTVYHLHIYHIQVYVLLVYTSFCMYVFYVHVFNVYFTIVYDLRDAFFEYFRMRYYFFFSDYCHSISISVTVQVFMYLPVQRFAHLQTSFYPTDKH